MRVVPTSQVNNAQKKNKTSEQRTENERAVVDRCKTQRCRVKERLTSDRDQIRLDPQTTLPLIHVCASQAKKNKVKLKAVGGCSRAAGVKASCQSEPEEGSL